MQIKVFCNPEHSVWDGILSSVRKDHKTEYVTWGEIREIDCTARLKVQAYHRKCVKDGNNFSKPKSGYWICEEGSFLSLFLRIAL